jgi:hypothetical protein
MLQMDEPTVGAVVDGDEALPDLAELDDPEFLAERKRVREELERTPVWSGELATRLAVLDEEFIRRARAAWAHAK